MKSLPRNQGQVMMIAAIGFLAVALLLIGTESFPPLALGSLSRTLADSKTAFFLAEGSLEEQMIALVTRILSK